MAGLAVVGGIAHLPQQRGFGKAAVEDVGTAVGEGAAHRRQPLQVGRLAGDGEQLPVGGQIPCGLQNQGDLETANGVIHVIDSVIMP